MLGHLAYSNLSKSNLLWLIKVVNIEQSEIVKRDFADLLFTKYLCSNQNRRFLGESPFEQGYFVGNAKKNGD